MDIESLERREKMLALREELLCAEEDRVAGRKGCTLDALETQLNAVINGAQKGAPAPNLA